VREDAYDDWKDRLFDHDVALIREVPRLKLVQPVAVGFTQVALVSDGRRVGCIDRVRGAYVVQFNGAHEGVSINQALVKAGLL
jgi:hypothetical protein